ncbi:MAG: hypothetical protein IID41_07230 [Planctomycetes bacterium]|nr:hypothetical protein [Planctomycetota bacterium]
METANNADKLTDSEIDVLLESLESWKHKDTVDDLFGLILSGMAGRDSARGRAFEQEEKIRKEEARKAKVIRSERAILISAKLIQMRQSRAAESVLNQAAQTQG